MSTDNMDRYVVYMPIRHDAETLPFYVPKNAEVEKLSSAVRAHPNFKRLLEHETLHLYRVILG